MQTQQHPQDDRQNRSAASKDIGRGDRRGPQFREVQEEDRRALGEEFRLARLQRGDDLPAVAAKLRIRQDHLQAIEDGRFEALPGQTYAIGFLRTYANHLGLDPDAVLARYRQESRSDTSASTLYFPEPIKEARRPRTWIVALALVVLGGLYAAWYYGSAERRVAQGVWPLPDRVNGSTASTATQPDGTAAPSASTVASDPTAAGSGFGETAAQTSTQSADTTSAVSPGGSSASGAQPQQAPYPTADAQSPPPPTLRGQGAPGSTAPAGDTAVAAGGPQDWRAGPTGSAPTPGIASASPSEPFPTNAPNDVERAAQPNPSAGASNSLGLNADGTYTAPQAATAPAPGPRNRSPEFGNLIDAARNRSDMPQNRVAALPRDEANHANPYDNDPAGAVAPAEDGTGGAQQALATTLRRVTLHARGATWVQLETQDGSVLISRIFQPGESYQLPEENGLTLTTGNAGGLDIEVNGNHTGPIGQIGAVRRHISIDRLRADAR